MAWPTDDLSTSHYDAGTDDPSLARSQLIDLKSKVSDVIAARNQANGVCGLDANGKVPMSRIYTTANAGNVVTYQPDRDNNARPGGLPRFYQGWVPGLSAADHNDGDDITNWSDPSYGDVLLPSGWTANVSMFSGSISSVSFTPNFVISDERNYFLFAASTRGYSLIESVLVSVFDNVFEVRPPDNAGDSRDFSFFVTGFGD
jgi:hypothetical protein